MATLCTNQGSYSSAYGLLTATTGTITRTNATYVSVPVSFTIKKSSSTSYKENKYFLLLNTSNTVLGAANISSYLNKSLSGVTSLSGSCAVPLNVSNATSTSIVVRTAISKSSTSVSASGTLVWNGRTNTNTSPCSYQNCTLTFSNYMAKVTPAAGTYIASVSGGGTVTKGSAVSIACTLGSATGYTYAFSKWTSSNTSAVATTTTRSPSISTSSIAPGGSVTMTASATRSVNSYTLTVQAGDYVSSVSGGGSKSYGSTVSISASLSSATGYTTTFANWVFSGGKTGNVASASTSFSMPAAAVTAKAYGKRSANSYTLTVQANNSYISSVSGGGSKTYNTSVTINCVVASATGYTTTFANWTFSGSKTGTGTGPSNTFTMPAGAVTAKAYATRTANTYTQTFSDTLAFTQEAAGQAYHEIQQTDWTFTGNTSVTMTYDTTNVTAVAPTANSAQLTFQGWYTGTITTNSSSDQKEITLGSKLPTGTWSSTTSSTYYAIFTGSTRKWIPSPSSSTTNFISVVKDSVTGGSWLMSEDLLDS